MNRQHAFIQCLACCSSFDRRWLSIERTHLEVVLDAVHLMIALTPTLHGVSNT